MAEGGRVDWCCVERRRIGGWLRQVRKRTGGKRRRKPG